MHITLIYIIWLRIQADDAYQRGSELPPVLCHPNPSGVQAGVGVGTDIQRGEAVLGPVL